jgi:hypothetical protein
MSPAVRAEPVGAREKIRLEDRLQHQLQGGLDHPIPHRGNPQATHLAATLGDHPFTHRQRAEAAVLQLRPQLIEEHLDAPHGLNVVGGLAVHPGRACSLVAPHPNPGDQKERRVGDEVVKIIEPAMRILAGPTVQLGLNLPYPSLRPIQRELRFVGVHRRQPPGIPASSLPTCWSPSPCARLSRARTTTGPPPHPRPPVGNGPAHQPGRIPGGRATVSGSHVHLESLDEGGARLYPDSIATVTPQTFTMASPPDQ